MAAFLFAFRDPASMRFGPAFGVFRSSAGIEVGSERRSNHFVRRLARKNGKRRPGSGHLSGLTGPASGRLKRADKPGRAPAGSFRAHATPLQIGRMSAAKPRETELYPPVKALLEGQGYEVKSEIGAADVVAVRDGEDRWWWSS
jgi:hypothetical protein